MLQAGVHASLGIQIAVYAISGSDEEGGREERVEDENEGRTECESRWRGLVTHLAASAARLLPLLPLHMDFFLPPSLSPSLLPHVTLNLALTCVNAIPLGYRRRAREGGREEGEDGREEGALLPLVAAVTDTVWQAVENLGKAASIKAMLQEGREGGREGGGQGLWEGKEEEETDEGWEGGREGEGSVECLAQAQRLGLLDKLVVFVCSAGSLIVDPRPPSLPPSSCSSQGRGLTDEEKGLADCLAQVIKHRPSLAAVTAALKAWPVLERVLQLLLAAKEKSERPVRVVLLRFLPVLLEGISLEGGREGGREDGLEGDDDREGGTEEGREEGGFSLVVAGCLAVGLRLLHLWRLPQDPSWSDPDDPALPSLARFLAQLLLLVDVRSRNNNNSSSSSSSRRRRRSSRSNNSSVLLPPRVRLTPSSLHSFPPDPEDLSRIPLCLDPHLSLLLLLALPFSALIDGSLPPSTRLPTIESLFHLLTMSPPSLLYSPSIKPSAQALCLAFWGLLGDGETEVRETVAERSIGFLVQQGKLARLMVRSTGREGGRASAGGRALRSGNGREDEGGKEEGEWDPERIPCEWAVKDLINRLKTSLRGRQAALEEDACVAPLLLGTLLQAMGAIATRAPVEKGFESVYLWVVLRLVDVWTEDGMICSSFAYEQLVRVARKGKYRMEEAMARDADEVLPLLLRRLVKRGVVEAFVREVLTDEESPRVFLDLSLKYAVAAVVQEEDEDDLTLLAQAWGRHVEPTLRGMGREGGGEREGGTAVERMLVKLAPVVVPRLLVEDVTKVCFLMDRLPKGHGGLNELMAMHDQMMFCELVWEWGEAEERGEEDRAARAHRALEILTCTKRNNMLVFEDQQQQQQQQQQGPPKGASVEDVQDFVGGNFLFALSKSVLPVGWEQRTVRKNAIAMRCLRLMLELMGVARVPAFLPKILSIMKVMLWEGGGEARGRGEGGEDEVKEMACHVMSTFVRSLPDADLRGNMAVLVVTLLPAILPLSQWAGDTAWYSETVGGGEEEALFPHHHPFPSRQAPLPLHSQGRTALLQLLNWLIVTKQPSLHPSFKAIPFLPHQLPELAEARQVFADSLPPTSQTTPHLRRLLVLLAHHSPEVRYATLRQLRAFLKQNHQQIYNLILGADDTAAEEVISELLTVRPSLPPSLPPSLVS